jgi:predicted PolB exonuclease-like 3'-5' exonuclease
VVKLGVVKGEEEVDQITGFVRLVQERRPTLITFNGRGFDLPVITARCMRYGIPFPYRFTKSVSHRYGDAISGHFDVMDHLSDFGATKPASLDAWARLVGMPGKGDVSGDDVAKLYADGQLDKIRAYCLDDVVQHYAIGLRVHLLRGLPEEGYITAMKSLLAAVEAEPMVAHMLPKMNVKRLLLEQETEYGVDLKQPERT